ncbi:MULTISPECIES: ABC transporter ATP-binding protein [unclassified Sinorhizobium]|uniref:ABC transporter ATP-binding protein n=1 Tax=unclassified Sinorhizobium TaxID=2613772 RepID=UPI003524A182
MKAASATAIRLEALSKTYDKLPVIENLSATIEPGEFTVILGPSGCGKSTLLGMIAGLERVTGGRILFGGREVQALEPRQRGCAMVFQNYALYPHMTVARNMDYSLRIAGMPRSERDERVRKVATMMELDHLLDRRPGQLSGGQRQRVAIGRAIIREPQVLLFDEPLSNLDARLRNEMRLELSQLHRRIGATSIFVTHDQVEAMTLADRVMILNKGRIEQFDRPGEIYRNPASTFVAGFLGAPPMNLIQATAADGRLRIADGTVIAPCGESGKYVAGIRPEHIAACAPGDEGAAGVRVLLREELGLHTVVTGVLPSGERLRWISPPDTQCGTDDVTHVRLPATHLKLFSAETGLAVRTPSK